MKVDETKNMEKTILFTTFLTTRILSHRKYMVLILNIYLKPSATTESGPNCNDPETKEIV